MAEPAASTKSTPNEPVAAKPVRRKRGRWLKRGFVLLILVGILGWFAPTIIATTDLRNQLPKLLMPTFPGSLEFGETSLAWTSPIVSKNFRVLDESGHPVFEIGQFSTTETLWTLVTRPQNLGTFKFVDPVIHVSLHQSDSNIEQILAKLFGDVVFEKRESVATVEVNNGRIELDNVPAKRQSTIDNVSLRLVSVNGAVDELDLAIGNPPESGADATTTDWIAARYGTVSKSSVGQMATAKAPSDSAEPTPPDAQPPATDKPVSDLSGVKQLVLKASYWKLDRLSPLLPRLMAEAELNGELTADSTVGLSKNELGIDWDWNGTVSIQRLLVAGVDALKQDRLNLKQIDLSGRAVSTSGRLAMHDLKLVTDVGELTATGDIPLDSRTKKSSLELVQSLLSDEDYHIAGRVDLKQVAALLPQTLRLREGIEVTSGDVKVQFVGVDVQGVRRWSGTSEIAGLSALKQGQKISWDKPISARMNAHRDQKTIVVDLVECKSDFLQIAGKGTLDDAKFVGTGDLSNLLKNLERFVDLGIDQLSGQVNANGELKRGDNEQVALTAKILLDDFAYVVSKDNVWREKHLDMFIVATGQVDAKPMLTRIETGKVQLTSGIDAFDCLLQQPVDLTSKSPSYSATAKLSGGLTSWQNRLRPFAAVDNWRFGGTINLDMAVSADPEQLQLSQLTIGLKDLAADAPGWLIKDPDVKFDTTGRWDMRSKTWSSPKISLTGKSLTMDVKDLQCTLGQTGIAKLTGQAAYRADLVQLSGWKNLAIPNPSYYLIGTLTGTANATQQDQALISSIDAQVEKMVVAGLGTGPNGQPQWVALWKEPQLKIVGKGTYHQTSDSFTLESSQVSIDGLSAAASGKLGECSTNQRIDLTGDLNYDWDALMTRLQQKTNQNIQLSGKDHRPFSIKGSLASLSGRLEPATGSGIQASTVSFPSNSAAIATDNSAPNVGGLVDLTGQAGLGWTTANIYGIKAGAGDLSVQIEQGVCRFAPLDIVVNDGKLHVTPTIYLDRNPSMLVLPQEKLIDHVSLSQELCGNSLKFIVPMLSDSTQVEGKISVDMQGASLPLGAVSTGTANGVLSIHGAQARPGSVALQIVGAINQIRSIISRQQPGNPNGNQVWLDLPEQQVPFKLEQGRMYHQGLSFVVSNVAVKTSGSVGTDTSLDLVAEIAVRDEWLGNNKILTGLKGKSIQIPISGTTSRSQIDPSIFSNLAQQIGGSATEGVLEDKIGNGLNGILNNGLDKLLKGK